MLRTCSIIVKNSNILLKMMEDSRAIYDQSLYFLRQAFFESKKSKENIKQYSYNELWNFVKNTEVYINSKLDTVVKQASIRQAVKAWKLYLTLLKDYNKNPKKYLTIPKLPGYLYKRKNYNVIQIDSSRFRYKWCKENQLRLPKTNYHIQIPFFIKKENIHAINISKYYNKIKIDIIYEDLKYIDNAFDKNSVMSIDLGLNNLCAITINDKPVSYIIKGGALKSMNQYYNKKKASVLSKLNTCNNISYSKKLYALDIKRKNKVYNFMHNVANTIIKYAIANKVEKIVIGHNKNWKQNINIGKNNNQNFVTVPFNVLIDILKYKAERYINLSLSTVEESYTSICDHLANEKLCHHDSYLGERIKRGLFISSTGKALNSDINGAIGILRKVNAITDEQLMLLRDRGDVVSPKVLYINP